MNHPLFESLEGRSLFAASPLADPSAAMQTREALRQPKLPRFEKVDDSTAVEPIATYTGKLTTDEGDVKRFMLQIISDDGTNVVARIPGREGMVEVTGTKSGDAYSLSAEKDGRSVSVEATIDDAGAVTGTVTHSFTNADDAVETHTGTIALTLAEKPTKPETPPEDGEGDGEVQKPVRAHRPPHEKLTDLVVYTGTINNGENDRDVFVETFTNREGKTILVIASKHRFGPRPIVIEATLTDTSITASKSVDDRSVDINLTIGADGSLTGTVELVKGETSRALTVDATKVDSGNVEVV